jgi:hypothetical protein
MCWRDRGRKLGVRKSIKVKRKKNEKWRVCGGDGQRERSVHYEPIHQSKEEKKMKNVANHFLPELHHSNLKEQQVL